jgi:hypothetical protein
LDYIERVDAKPEGERDEDECPPDCQMCSGEFCATHGGSACDCDTADRHLNPSEREPATSRQVETGGDERPNEPAEADIAFVREQIRWGPLASRFDAEMALDRLLTSRPSTVDGERERLIEAAWALVNRLHEVHASDGYRAVWTNSTVRRGPYRGPTYTAELTALHSTLARSAPVQPAAGEPDGG